jgi:hypothetical protein
MIWGWVYSVDAKGCNENVSNPDMIKKFGDELIEAVNMEKHGECQLEYFGKDNKKGWTYSQLITTSNCCIHFCDSGEFFFDLFSCKEIDRDVVDKLIYKYFDPMDIKNFFRERGI